VALAVTLTVCDAQQVGLSPSYRFLLLSPDLASFQMKRVEQKAPKDLFIYRASDESLASRSQLSGGSRELCSPKVFRYALAPTADLHTPFCQRVNSCESPRAPPLMDPPILC